MSVSANVKINVITTATISYIPIALIALLSAKKNADVEKFYIFVPDVEEYNVNELKLTLIQDYPWVNLISPFELMSPQKENYLLLKDFYSDLEFCSLGKFIGIHYLLSRKMEADLVVYLDTDLYFVDQVEFETLISKDCSVALSPQLMSPLNDELEHDIMIHGWINAGFMIFNARRDKALEIVDWLIDRISKRGLWAPYLGLNCDQTWVSALPTLFNNEVCVMNNVGINVAYWNLPERKLVLIDNQKILVNNLQKLIFFHFSGFNFKNSQYISKHSTTETDSNPALLNIATRYKMEYENLIEIRKKLSNIVGFKFSQKRVLSRAKKIKDQRGIDLFKTMRKPGFFGQLGMNLDSLCRIVFRR